MFGFGMGMDLLVPEAISLISNLGAVMVLIKAGFMSSYHSLEERMALWQPANNVIMTCTGGMGHALSSCLLGCGTQHEAEDEADVCVLCCQKRSTVAVCDECKEHYCTELTPTLVGPMLFVKYNTDDSWSC